MASVKRQAQWTSRVVSENPGVTAAVTVAAGAVGVTQKLVTGDVLAPAVLTGTAAVGVAALVEHLLPSDGLAALERIGNGPHAESLTTLVVRLVGSRPHDQQTVRSLVLSALTALEDLLQACPSSSVRRLAEGMVVEALGLADASEASKQVFLDALTSIKGMVQGPQALQTLTLSHNLMRNGMFDSPKDLLSKWEVLARSQESGLAQLLARMCPQPEVSKHTDDPVLNGLIEIAKGSRADVVLSFIKDRLDSCSDGPALALMHGGLADAMPTLCDMSRQSRTPRVMAAFNHVLATVADETRGELQLALLKHMQPFKGLFEQSPGAATGARSVAFRQQRVPLGAFEQMGVEAVAQAAIHLAATPELCRLLDLSTPQEAVEFWLSTAADRTIRG